MKVIDATIRQVSGHRKGPQVTRAEGGSYRSSGDQEQLGVNDRAKPFLTVELPCSVF